MGQSPVMSARAVAANPVAWLAAISAALALAYGVGGQMLRDAGVPLDVVGLFKASSIVMLAAIAAVGRAPRLIVWALVFGAAGDFLLARGQLPHGALAFALGHVCYIRAFLRTGVGVRGVLTRAVPAIGAIVLVAAAIVSTLVLVPRASPLFAPLCVYTAVLTLMTLSSLTLRATHWPSILGAVLFFVSDGFVAANQFHAPADANAALWMGFVGWMIYWAGQAGLCLGMIHRPARPPQG